MRLSHNALRQLVDSTASARSFPRLRRRRYPNAGDEQNEHLGVILAATLTLLALIIGFSFSMATNRYDQRKNFEEGEANAIGTKFCVLIFYLLRMPQTCASFLASTRPAYPVLPQYGRHSANTDRRADQSVAG